MDSQIVFMAGIAFIFFLASHAILSRLTRPQRAIDIIVWSFLVIGAGQLWYLSEYWKAPMLIGWAIIYILLVTLYVFGVFAGIEASITLRILSEIARGGRRGLTKAQLLTRYNRDIVLSRRLKRLVQTGDVTVEGGLYSLRDRPSYFVIREKLIAFLWWLFPA